MWFLIFQSIFLIKLCLRIIKKWVKNTLGSNDNNRCTVNELLSDRHALTTGFLFDPTFLVFCIVTDGWKIAHRWTLLFVLTSQWQLARLKCSFQWQTNTMLPTACSLFCFNLFWQFSQSLKLNFDHCTSYFSTQSIHLVSSVIWWTIS